ncbi:HAE1 family hydrophobic/amphiphilic exporter-1 [Tahibacter aquaticus]|uniref:HAE1 family hydrophobic/amphiphilic exporter-1 n=1 Tax=Tahibacter aquaticus TaxID=520092 RepID=A0A4R6YYM2_9GAMM|nr:efflux RND transporter permease subunit [Tahibacter aquaticus]TDR44134.1 HAE1 family hydrophobic/amphiphilic exporter-1 [Tahibacter aquaticus]
MNLAELSLKRPVTVMMFFVSMMVIGLIAAVRLPLEKFPDIEFPFLFVDVPYPGSTPAEVERVLARPIEEALSTVPGIQRMQSTSRADGVQIFIQFKWGNKVAIKAVEAREKIDAIRKDLPSDLQRYQVLKFSASDQPLLQLRVASDIDMSNSYELLDRRAKRPLEKLPGVARVDLQGVSPPELQIELSSDRIAASGVGLNELFAQLSKANFSVSAGQILDGATRYRVQPQGEWKNLDDARNLVINDRGLKLGDIATVSLKPERLDYMRRLDKRPAIGIDIYKERNANLVEVGRLVKEEVERIKQSPEMRGIDVYALEDQASAVTSSLYELSEAGVIGTLLSVLVLFYFLRDWHSTLMVSLAIPICFVMTLGCMYFFGITLNILSMMGLLLAVGMLVDNAVVVVESIYQYREKYPDKPWYCAVQGTQAVGVAIAAGTFASIVVFLPNIFGAKNQISIFLTQVAVAMSIAHLASWLVAVTLVPMLSARLPTPKFVGRKTLVTRLQTGYANLIGWTLRHRILTAAGVVLMSVISVIGPMMHTKFDMFPAGEGATLRLQYDLNGLYRLEELKKSIGKIEDYLLDNKDKFDIKSVYSYANERGDAMTNVILVDAKQLKRSSSEIMEDIRKDMPKIPVGKATFDNNGGGSSGEGLRISLVGDSMDQLHELSQAVIPVLSRVTGLRDVRTAERTGDREVAVRVDRERAKSYGFSATEVASYVGIALRGAPLREFRNGDTEIPVWLRFQGADTQSVAGMSDFKLRRADGTLVPLLSLVDVRTQDAASAIQRDGRQTSLPIVANLAPGTTQEDARKAIESAMKSVSLPAGYRWTFGRSFDESDEAGQQMLLNTLLALVLVYVVMCAMFESLVFPAAILTTFLFSIFGVFWLFWLTGTTFSIMASIGVLILMGVVVNNGIVMIVHVNQLRHAGMPRFEALVEGARDRLRPILMTMGTAILGMVPLCISSTEMGGDGPPYYPMARAIAGGLVFSTGVTLLALPVIYSQLDDMRMWVSRVFRDARSGQIRRRPAPEV